ncbi:MAG: ABC transporter permease [Elusimicrobiota bacterium]|jgi:ABC-2 type transport system permease protein|nr:ABC transporter permease [Elusimicrobiota bacterium]
MNFKVIKGFFIKELIQTFRDKKMAAMIFAAPIIQLTLFGFALTSDIQNIKMLALYEPDDILAQRIENDLAASGYFIKALPPQGADIIKSIDKRESEVILVFPQGGLKKTLDRGGANMQILIDAVNMQRAIQIENYVKNIVRRTISGELNVAAPLLINPQIRILYNPSMKSSYFMIPALMGFLLCIITVIITSMSFSKEKEFGAFEKLISSPASAGEILIGKTLPYTAIGFMAVPAVLITGIVVFGVPAAGGIFKIFLSCFIFIISSCSIAIFISTFAKTQQQAMLGSFMFLLPAMILSGLIFPIENMPQIIRWTAYLNPLYYLIVLLRNIMLKGGDWIFVFKNCAFLLGIGAVLAFVGVKKFYAKL